MTYRAPISDFNFLFEHIVGLDRLSETEKFEDMSLELTDAILNEAAKLSEQVLAPLQRPGDLEPAVLENGVVRTSPGYAEGYKQIAEGGWVGMAASPENGGMGLPMTVATAVNEMMGSACLSLELNPLMSQGQIEALEHHASDQLKAIYLPKLISGEWNGTMNLTEPQAGSDVGALSSRAVPNDDGSYDVSGQKIFISWGDNDFTSNVCHLVLARLPDGVPGTKGISLFMVPKFIPDDNGEPGVANSLRVVSLEHKMGLHGSPTAVMEYDNATGWLIGEPHKGMAAMFTMMNNARLGVGVQGLSSAEGAYQHALNFALERKQGHSPVDGGNGTIVDHADVRRMLLSMKADVFASRAIALSCAMAIDLANANGDAHWKTRAALLTPINKAFGTDTGIRVSEMGLQVHGGMGFIEETGAAQYCRDVRVTAIYEGTNGIQAMDLVGRKMMDGGAATFTLIDEIKAGVEAASDSELAVQVGLAADALRATTQKLATSGSMNDRFAGAVPYLSGFARVLGGYYHLLAAEAESGNGSRTKLARFYINRLLPEHVGLFAHATQGADDLYAFDIEELANS